MHGQLLQLYVSAEVQWRLLTGTLSCFFFLTMMAPVFQHRFLAVFYRLALIVFAYFYAAIVTLAYLLFLLASHGIPIFYLVVAAPGTNNG